MKKRFTILIAAAVMLLTTMAATGTMWGQSSAVLPNTQTLTTEFANVGTDENIKIKTSSANDYTNPLRFYANVTTTIQAQTGYKILSVTYEASSTGNYVTYAQEATVTPNVTPTVSGKNVTWDYSASENDVIEYTFKPSSQTRCNSITIVYTTIGGSGSSAVATTVTIDASGITNTDVYEATTAGSLSATVTETESGDDVDGATVTWSGNNDNVATIDESTGEVTLVAAGTVTFTASYAGVTDEFQASYDIYEMTVTSSAPYVQPNPVVIDMNYQWLGSTNGGNLTNNQLPVVKNNDNVTTTIAKGSASTNPRGDGDYIRIYNGSTLKFEAPSGYDISEIEFTTGGNNSWAAPTVSTGTLSSKTWTGKAESVTFTMTGSCFIASVSISLATASSVATPTFSPEAGTYTETQSVTITCETEGASIFYTTDGTAPTNASTPYTDAINVTETTTIKAIAYVGDEASNVASSTYNIVTPYTTIPAIFAKAQEVGSTQTDIYVTFDNWTVVGKSYSNAYVTDGQYGLNVYGSGSGFAIGDQLSGTVACKVQLYTQGAELVNLSTATPGLTVTHNNSFEPYAISLADLTGNGIYFGSYVDLGNLTYSNSTFNDGNENVINPNNTFSITGYPTLTEGKTYRVKGVYIRYNSTTERIAPVYASDFTEVVAPMLSIDPTTAAPFTYVLDNGPSEDQTFEVTGTNLSSDDIVATITTGAEYFEITDDETYSSTVTVNSGGIISIRLKAGLALGNYAGALTLTNEGAENVVVALSGSVTGQTYSIELDDQVENGTITADMASAPAGATVTLTATPDAGYELGEWTVLDGEANEITVINNQFEMPASDVLVSATFTAKPTYAITTVVTPTDGGTVVTLDNAYEGQNVEVAVEAETGFTFSSLVVSKKDDATTTVETTGNLADGFTFTMPGYPVTVTATFFSNSFEGTFIKVTSLADIIDGGYYILYDTKAMNSTISSGRMGATVVKVNNDAITNPDLSIVWKLVKNGDSWDLYSEKEAKYCYISTTNSTSAFVMAISSFYHYNISIYDGGFKFLTTSGSERGIGYASTYDDFRTYSNSLNPKVYLYKYTVLTEHTITFNGNGGTYTEGDTYTQTVYDGIAANLDANQFTYGSSIFVGWSTTQDGEVEYADGASITVSGDITLYAQWATSYTAMVDDQIVGGTVKVNGEDIVDVAAGTEMTLTYTANPGYAFSAWNVYKDGDETTTVTVTDDKFTMPEYDVIVSASFVEVTTYSLVTNVSQIVSGKHYVIASGTNGSVNTIGTQRDSNRGVVAASATNGIINETEGLYELVINGPETITKNNEQISVYTIYDASYPGYLYASSSSANQLKTRTNNTDANSQWTIEVTSEGVVTFKAQGSYTRNVMRYNPNNNSPLFACYSGTTGTLPYLFVKDNDNYYEYYGTEINYAETSIPDGDTITVGAGSVMTVPENFENTDPKVLVIEDGGQLIHNEPVSATIQRNVTGYGRSNPSGYQFIASPVNDDLNVDETNLTTSGSYDLYIFDQSQPSKEWRNYKADAFTTIGNGVGYLYANTTNITISFSGELKPSDNDVPVILAFTEGNRCSGWNLVGNPFACKAYIKGATGGIEAFYRMNGNGDGYDAVVGAINPMEGIFVQANAIDQQFSFTRTAPDATPGKGNLNIQVAQVTNTRDAQSVADNAIIRFDGGSTLQKFSFRDNNAKIYFTRDNKDYAVVNAQAQGEMPVNFKAAENGTYTIDFSMDNVEFSYLHLIDNKTGMDIDLLQTSSYTFEASKIDYASRFKLVFSTNNNSNSNDDNDFAFFDANGNLMILGIEGTATLQVIDITGRAISNETFSGNYSKAINAKAGVYMLRLIQGNDVRTQKIVVR